MRKFEVGDLIEAIVDGPAIRNGERFFVTGLDCNDNVMFMDSDDDKRVRRPEEFRLVERAELITESDPINHPAHYAGSNGLTGGLSNYYLSRVEFPQREDQPAYTAECEDLIESLRLNPDEANIFKEIWRSANARLGNGKPDHKALYGAEKINHYAGRNLRRVKREAGGV